MREEKGYDMRHTRRVSTLAAAVVAVALTLPTSAMGAQAGGSGSGSGGSGGGGGADTTGSSYSDLVIALRAGDGTPILKKFVVPGEGEDPATVEYCVQPVSYESVPGVAASVNPLDGRDVWVLPLQGEWIGSTDPLPVAEIEACDPKPQYAMFVQEVELERLNMSRTKEDVIAQKIADVQTKLRYADQIALESTGRLTFDGTPIDASPENAGMYQSLMTSGTIPGLHPENMVGGIANVGPTPKDATSNSQFDAWELAAMTIGASASKNTPINVDTIEYYNRVIGFPPDDPTATPPVYSSPWGVQFVRSENPDSPGTQLTEGERFVNYNNFRYNRSETFKGSVTWLDIPSLTWKVSKITDVVPFTNLSSYDEIGDKTLTGITAFAQLADDVRAMCNYVPDNTFIPGFYMDVPGVDTTEQQLNAIHDPAVDLGTLPENVFKTFPFQVTASLLNPFGGELIPDARVRLTIDAPDGDFTSGDDVTATAVADSQSVPFTVDASGNLVGWWGPETGFPVKPGYNVSTTFDVTVADTAPSGDYNLTLDLVTAADTATVLASESGTIKVNDNVATVLWGDSIVKYATQGSAVKLPVQVYSPAADTAGRLTLTIQSPGDDPLTTALETLAAGDVKVYGSTGTDMVSMEELTLVAPDELQGTWDATFDAGYNPVTWYVTVAEGAPVGNYAFGVSLEDGNPLDSVLIAFEAPEAHGEQPPGSGEDTAAPVVTITAEGTPGVTASFLLAANEADVTFESQLTKNGEVTEAWATATSPKTYADLTPGTYVFSTRGTDKAGNTSEVETKSWVVAETPSTGDGGTGGTGGTGGGSDVTAPVVRIAVVDTAGSSAAFNLSTEATESGVTFACRLTQDGTGGPWTDCTTGATGAVSFTDLEPGSYVLSVTATDAAGNVSDVASTAWVVPVTAQQGAPRTQIQAGPADRAWVLAETARFRLGSDIDGAQFRVRVNKESAGTCDPGSCVVALGEGRNRIRFVARVAGNPDRAPVVRTVFVPHGVAGLRLSAGWRLRDGSAHLFGTFAQTTKRGELLRQHSGGIKRIMLVASTGPRFGKVNVYLGRTRLTAKPIDLSDYRTKAMRTISVRTFGKVHQGVVKVVVVSKNRPVRVDGLGIASR